MLPLPLLAVLLSAAVIAQKNPIERGIQLPPNPDATPVATYLTKHYFQPKRLRRQAVGGDSAASGSTGVTGGDTATGGSTTTPVVSSDTGTGTGTASSSTASSTDLSESSSASSSPTSTPSSSLPTSASASSSSTPLSVSSSTPGSSSSSGSASSSSSASSSQTSSSSSTLPSSSLVTSTFVSVITNSVGDVTTSTGTSVSEQTKSASPSTNKSSSTGKTWGIVGGVVGGVIVLVAIIFVVYRCSSRRFSSLDDEGDAIRWPELNPDGQTISAQASTLNPLGTRRTGRAGVEMSEIDGSEWGGDRGDISAEAAAEYHPNGQSAYDRVPFSDTPTDAGNRASYQYDPYLGPSAAPYPPPQNIYPPAPSNLQYSKSSGTNLVSSNSASSYASTPTFFSNDTADPFASHADAYPIAPSPSTGRSTPENRRMSTVRESYGGEQRAMSPPSVYERSGTPTPAEHPPPLVVVNADRGLPEIERVSSPEGGPLQARNI